MYLGLDLGTSGLKGVLVNDLGEIIASHNAALGISRPNAGWSEQAPSDWAAALFAILGQFRHEHTENLSKVCAIGLSGQMHGATVLDKSGQILRPAILWNDMRAHEEAAWLDSRDDLKTIFANVTFPGFTAPKIVWMQRHESSLMAKAHKILLPKDYLRYLLTGEYVSEMSDASGTAWLDISRRKWSDELLAACSLTSEHMPRLVEGSEISATLSPKIANEFGLQHNIPIAGGAGDNAATAMGLGITDPGTGFLSLGTSGVVFAVSDGFAPGPESAIHAFCHAIPEHWHQMGVTLSATDSLNWLARQLGEEAAKLVNGLGEPLTPPGREMFLPFLGGERTPHNSEKLTGGFYELTHSTDRPALVRAVLEGVIFSLKQCLELMDNSGCRVNRLLAVGGGAQSDYWLSLAATILERTLERPVGAENAAAMGAARLAALTLGEDLPVNTDGQVFTPSEELTDLFGAKYDRYLARCENELARL